MPENTSNDIEAYLDKFYGDEVGKVYFATLTGGVTSSFKQFFTPWPLNKQKLLSIIPKWAGEGRDVFFCPAMFDMEAPKPERAYVKSVNSHWLDFDGNAPSILEWQDLAKEKNLPEPSLIVQSSVVGQQHAYWFTDRASGSEALDAHETITRNLTAAFNTDKSGWDLNQLLRVPGTFNYGFKPSRDGGIHKPWYDGEPVLVSVIKASETRFPQMPSRT